MTVGSADGGAAGTGRPGSDGSGGGRPGLGSAGGDGSGRTSEAGEWMNPGSWRYAPGLDENGNWRFFRLQGGSRQGGLGSGGSQGLAPGGGGDRDDPGNRTGGGSGAVTKQVLRITMQVITELER